MTNGEPPALAGLAEAARGGDPRAVAALLAAAQPDVRRMARRACLASDVDDAVQDALWTLARRVGALRRAAALPAWLWAVTRRLCLRHAGRAMGRHDPLEDHADDLRLASRPAEALRLDLAAAIAALPPHYREAVLLRDVEELTVDEMAGALGLTREAAKARLHRARALLRERLRG